ncbi:hypothetical protein DCE93_01735 [Agromyces badenianii]|uniref:Uncharacterized protein n=1 Tax=Agromyces badenianii TaxID=2080742 RepID=A0A2S0WT70_9MICO|nr:YbaK/EbsC family protein [Agromyces badenianii]AWB94546.1 hypothetical protein DCE93_01735 [Agromyces badenianii]PWC03664.1 hypothetical protein DCE94_11695 [Agromyces badenianii]
MMTEAIHTPAASSTDLVAVSVLDRAEAEYTLHSHPPVMRAEDHANSGLALDRSAKTLAFLVSGEFVALVCLPAMAKLSYGQLATVLGRSRSQIKPAPAEYLERLEMKPGGVGPFTTDPDVKVVIDQQVLEYPVVYCGSGDPCVTVELTPAQLERACPTAITADVTS